MFFERICSTRTDGEIAELHRRASQWFAANEDVSQAISHALAGGDTGRAADLMELAMPVMRRERREAELARWIRAVPDEVLQVRPVLAMAFVGGLALHSDFATVGARLADIERSVRSPDGTWPERPPPGLIVVDELGYRSLHANVELYRAALALANADLDAHGGTRRSSIVADPA